MCEYILCKYIYINLVIYDCGRVDVEQLRCRCELNRTACWVTSHRIEVEKLECTSSATVLSTSTSQLHALRAQGCRGVPERQCPRSPTARRFCLKLHSTHYIHKKCCHIHYLNDATLILKDVLVYLES